MLTFILSVWLVITLLILVSDVGISKVSFPIKGETEVNGHAVKFDGILAKSNRYILIYNSFKAEDVSEAESLAIARTIRRITCSHGEALFDNKGEVVIVDDYSTITFTVGG